MNGTPRNVSNKERAAHDVRIMITATDLNPDGSPVLKSFSSIQRKIHATRISGMPPSRIDSVLVGLRYTDTHSLLRAVGALYDPKAFKEYDYRDIPDYEKMVEQIESASSLASMSPDQLYDFTLRRNKRPKGSDDILAIAKGIYAARKGIIIASAPIESAPPQPTLTIKTFIEEPDVKKRIFKTEAPLFSPTIATNLASRYLETVKPSDYELKEKELVIGKALAKMVRIDGPEPGDSERHVYKYTQASLTETLLINNPNASKAQIRELVGLSALRITERYGIAAALVMKRGSLPSGSPNMENLLDYLHNYSVDTSRGIIFPYQGISAGCLRSIYSGLTSADELIRLDLLRANPNPLRQLGESLTAQKSRMLSSS
jgi:hypothetical protein